ncbi:MAG TPA: TetR/AcrR family transcriptional regulator [Solirubrobacteraceae bacterium]|nr:TetR/AcrR family transcriptional regulator [Solirubrobacteraceae bacterium]
MTAADPDLALRADAQRNRRQLLEAAAAAFAEGGIDVPADEIARRAGVAKGTLFRHFPTKEDLIAAVLRDRIGQVRAVIAEIEATREPGLAAVAELMGRAAAIIAADRSFFDAAMRDGGERPGLYAEKLAFEQELDALVARAQASGEVRADVVGADIAMLVLAATNTCAPSQALCPELWRRYLALMVDGLRPGATTPLAVPALDHAALEHLSAAAG